MARVHDEIERVRREKEGRELHEQLLWRIEVLGGDADLIDGENRRAFTEVLDAYVPENHSLVLNASERYQARAPNVSYAFEVVEINAGRPVECAD